MSDTVVIFHAGCADGFCAAWLLKKAFPAATLHPANYGDAPPDVAGKDVFIADFCYKRPVMLAIATAAKTMTVLDHHKTAEADLAGFVEECSKVYGVIPNVIFKMDRSGGRLVWEYLHGAKPAPWLVDYTEDRDLWRWKLPSSREVSAAVRSHPFSFPVWDEWGDIPEVPTSLIMEGAAILRFQSQLVDDAARFASEIEMDGHKVLSVNTTCLVSEVGERLAEGRPFSATFFVKPDGKKVWSLRSRGETGIDVSEVAKRRGGGGHKAAAGFTE